MNDLSQKTREEILARIAELQEIQKRNRSTSEAWQKASDELQPLFAEMAKREPSQVYDGGAEKDCPGCGEIVSGCICGEGE